MAGALAVAEPGVDEGESLAAAVIFQIVDARGAALAVNRDVVREAVGGAAEKLAQVDGRVGVVAHSEQEDLAVEVVDAADWTGLDVRRNR